MIRIYFSALIIITNLRLDSVDVEIFKTIKFFKDCHVIFSLYSWKRWCGIKVVVVFSTTKVKYISMHLELHVTIAYHQISICQLYKRQFPSM